MCDIDLSGLDKADALAALYNASRPQGMGFMCYEAAAMSSEEARGLLAEATRFDYLKGRVLKIDLSGDTLCPGSYDQDNGKGAASRAIDSLRQTQKVGSPEIMAQHKSGRAEGAAEAMNHLREESRTERGATSVVHLGLADVAEPLEAAIKKAKLKPRHLNRQE